MADATAHMQESLLARAKELVAKKIGCEIISAEDRYLITEWRWGDWRKGCTRVVIAAERSTLKLVGETRSIMPHQLVILSRSDHHQTSLDFRFKPYFGVTCDASMTHLQILMERLRIEDATLR